MNNNQPTTLKRRRMRLTGILRRFKSMIDEKNLYIDELESRYRKELHARKRDRLYVAEVRKEIQNYVRKERLDNMRSALKSIVQSVEKLADPAICDHGEATERCEFCMERRRLNTAEAAYIAVMAVAEAYPADLMQDNAIQVDNKTLLDSIRRSLPNILSVAQAAEEKRQSELELTP